MDENKIPTPDPSPLHGEGNKNPFIGWYRWRQEKRALGWVDCPMCDSEGVLWNRFTHRPSTCPLCDGAGLLNPQKIKRDYGG